MSPESEESTFTGLIQELLDAIRADDLNEEMNLKADIKGAFKLTPEQVNSGLFKSLSHGKLSKNPIIEDSVDLQKVKPLSSLMDGWLLEGDVSLLYGAFGTGKTTLGIYIAYNFAKGINVLDRSKPCKCGTAYLLLPMEEQTPLKKQWMILVSLMMIQSVTAKIKRFIFGLMTLNKVSRRGLQT